MTPRSWLFVPGDAPAKLEKALDCGADALILDLEDSVALPRKVAARDAVRDYLRAHEGHTKALWVRINPLSSGLAEADIAAVVAARPSGIVLPKPDSAKDLKKLGGMLADTERAAGIARGSVRILPIATETPLSIFNLSSYVAAGPRLAGLTWGAEDLSSAVGAATAQTETGAYTPLYELARSLCLAGATAAGVPAIETVYPGFRDTQGLVDYVARGRRDGFVSMMAIHPSQVEIINATFTPTIEEVGWARRVVDAFAADPNAGTLALDGKMLDAPHLHQARRLIARDQAASRD
jgi:citrate lyase subunit beta/citryl-CoA lyase